MRRLLRIAIGVAALLSLLFGWLLLSNSGARWLVETATQRVPGLSIARVEGTLLSGPTLFDLRWRDARTTLSIERLTWAASAWDLLFAPRHFSTMAADGVVVGVVAGATEDTAEGNGTPWSLPDLAVDALAVSRVQLDLPAGRFQIDRLNTGLVLTQRRIDAVRLSLSADGVEVEGEVTLDLAHRQPLTAAALRLAGVETDAAPAWRARISAQPSNAGTAVKVQVEAPFTADLEATLDSGLEQASAQLTVPRQSIAAWQLGDDIEAALRLTWDGKRLEPRGTFARADQRFAITGGALEPASDVLTLSALLVTLDAVGTVRMDGSAPLAKTAAWDLRIETDGLEVPRGDAPPLRISGRVSVEGPQASPEVVPRLDLRLPNLPAGRTDGRLQVDEGGVRADGLALLIGEGRIQFDGQLGGDGADTMHIQAGSLDPSWLAADWPGRIDIDLRWQGTRSPTGVDGSLALERLSGELRERPLQGQGSLVLVGSRWTEARLALDSGRARVRASLSAAGTRGSAIVDVPDLADLVPGLAGSLDLQWTREADDHLVARVERLRTGASRLLRADLDLRLARDDTGPFEGRILIDGLDIRGFGDARAELSLAGTRASHQATMQASLDRAQIELALDGRMDDGAWRGDLLRLIGRTDGADLRLREAAALTWSDDRMAVESFCVDGAGGHACLSAAGTADEGSLLVQLDSWSLATLGTLWPRLPAFEGLIDGRTRMAWRNGSPVEGELTLRSPRGLARFADRPDLDLGYRNLAVDGTWSPAGGTIVGGADLVPDGRIDVTTLLTPGADGLPGFDTTVDLLVRQLDGIEAFTTSIAAPEGEIRGQLRVQAGALPYSLSGALALTGFTAQVPSRALRLRDGVLVLAGVPGQLVVRGSVASGDGVLAIDGRIDTRDPVPALLRVTGDQVRVSNTPSLSIVASPDLTLALREQRWLLDGVLVVPRARIDASKLESGVDRSPDVLVVDDDAPSDPRRPWRARVKVVLGDDVRLEGFGFDGSLAGELAITQRQGAQAIANGEITLRGRYQAYGQRLQIQRGGLRYANSPLTEPTLDLRAERKVRDRTVALEITGSALRPESRIVGSAGLTDSEALSLLVTGRPLNQAQGGDRERLSDAAATLGSVGSDLLTRNLRGRLGLDELGISNDTMLDGEAFTLGKYLSPRLYVGLGIGLLTRGEVFTVRYLITDRLELEANSGETQRAAINYRLER